MSFWRVQCQNILQTLSLSSSALLWQKEATHKSPKSEKVMFLDWTLLAYSSSIPSLEQKHSSCWKIFQSRYNDIVLMSMYITDTFCSFRRNVIIKSCFLLSEYGSIDLASLGLETIRIQDFSGYALYIYIWKSIKYLYKFIGTLHF